MIIRPLPGIDAGTSPGAGALVRDPERRVAALAMSAVLLVGGGTGLLNLAVDGVLRDAARPVYAVTMLLTMAAAVPLLVRRRVGRRGTFALVLLGHAVYLVVALCMADPARHAPPLVLLFAALAAACILGPRQLTVTMGATTAVCLAALWPSFTDPVALALQVALNAGVLNATALGVHVLRRRVHDVLATTRSLATVDPLTGLHNRRHLVEQAPRLWRQGRRDGTQVVALVLDLDHFKRLNDEHGHAVGDAVLRSVSRALAAAVRPADVLVRTGGEELLVLGTVGDLAEAARLAERLRRAVAATVTDGHVVTASIGTALCRPVDGEDAAEAVERLVARADLAMYEAKRAGRDRVAATPVPPARAPRPGGQPVVPGPSPTDAA